MEDILEEIVGDIWDEDDIIEEDDIKEISDTVFEIDGDISIDDLCELINISEDEFDTESDTAGGWALEHFEEYPENGSTFEDYGYKVTILQIDERRVEKLRLEKLPEDEE